MAKLDKWELQHRRNLMRYTRQVAEIYRAAAHEAAAIGAAVPKIRADKPFSFADYPITHDRAKKLLNDLKNGLQAAIVNGANAEWTLANNKGSELARVVFGRMAGKLPKFAERRYFTTNEEARAAFLARTSEGLNLSDRVWRYTRQFKTEIELGLDVGIRNGQSAAEMARDLKQYLQNPDKLFRRVRDIHGDLQPSKAMRAYHPGQGVYRSSYGNALRLTADITNEAYRTADHLRWQQFDFVLGIHVGLSKAHPMVDICDTLVGDYPKDYKFTGFHVRCLCIATPILKTAEEVEEDLQLIAQGEEPTAGNARRIASVPDSFNDWVAENESRSLRWKELPRFIRDNTKYAPDMYIGFCRKYAPEMDAISQDIARRMGVMVTPINIKSKESIMRKAASEVHGLASIKDMVRNTFIVPAEQAEAVMSEIRRKFDIMRVKNQQTPLGYTGTLINIRKGNTVAEIQLNSAQMIYAKEPAAEAIIGKDLFSLLRERSGLPAGMGHKYYEEWRVLDALETKTARQIERMRELEKMSSEYYAAIRDITLE